MKQITIRVVAADTPERRLLWQARHKLEWSTEEFFHNAFEYAHEDVKKGSEVVQKMFIEYLHSGGEVIPEEVISFALDVMTNRVTP